MSEPSSGIILDEGSIPVEPTRELLKQTIADSIEGRPSKLPKVLNYRKYYQSTGKIAVRNGIKILTMLGAAFVAFAQIPSAYAQATRTWVSGVGDDANPCSRTAPCKTFAGAISKTAAGGEIDALDPAGFGAVTITKSITLDGGGGQVASILVAGTNAINVATGVSDVVTLRNLKLNGLAGTAGPGLDGIAFSAGAALLVENCDIFGFQFNGIHYTGSGTRRVVVMNTTLTNSKRALRPTLTMAYPRLAA